MLPGVGSGRAEPGTTGRPTIPVAGGFRFPVGRHAVIAMQHPHTVKVRPHGEGFDAG